MSNYPDDVRQHDSNPRSPFYDDIQDRYMEILSHEIAIDPAIMIDVLADSDQRYGNIVHILCMLFEKRYERLTYDDELNKFVSAWLELAEEAAKRYEENKRIQR